MRAALPNVLTVSRVVAIPVIVALMLVPGDIARWLACALFVLASATDYLDGMLARAWRIESPFGKLLDPIADKLLVVAVLFVLVGTGDIAGWAVVPAVVIVLREILVSGLREHLAGHRIGLPVTPLAKWKTAAQMGALTLLLLGDAPPEAATVKLVGEALLWIAAVLTAITGYHYLRLSLHHVLRSHELEAPEATKTDAAP